MNGDEDLGVDKRVKAALEALDIAYELIEIDPAFADTRPFCERYGYPLEQTCNTIIVATKRETTRLVACVVAGTMQLDVNKRVRKLAGARKASFAAADVMKEATGMEIGGVTPIALPRGMPLYVDDRLMEHEWVILGAGVREAKIEISPRVFSALGARFVAELGRR